MSIADPGSGHPSAAHDPNAVRFALHRLTQAQNAELIGGQNGHQLQFSADPNQLVQQYYRYAPLIAHQIHMGASLQQPHVHPLPAPGAGVHPQAAPALGAYHAAGAGGGYVPPQHPVTLPQQVQGAPGAPAPQPVDPNLLILNKLLGLPS